MLDFEKNDGVASSMWSAGAHADEGEDDIQRGDEECGTGESMGKETILLQDDCEERVYD